MRLFISWSGARSKAVAEALSSWIGKVIQSAEPWISSDIEKGARWSQEISHKLETSKIGIICLTPENLSAPWILFEAGALSKTKDAQVCTLLLGLDPSNVQPPLGQFQHTSVTKSEIRDLMMTINSAVASSGERALSERDFDESFETWWPKLESSLNEIKSQKGSSGAAIRQDRELLEEILDMLRSQERRRAIEQMKFHRQRDIERAAIKTLGKSSAWKSFGILSDADVAFARALSDELEENLGDIPRKDEGADKP